MVFIPFGSDVERMAREHALAVYPNEACGLVINRRYVRMPNLAPDPHQAFEMDPRVLARPGVEAIVHSHCDDEAWPSAPDMEQQLATGLPWGLCATNGKGTSEVMWWGPGIPTPPLLGREFRHGPSGSDGKGDCYALIKDWYAQERSVELPEFPRQWNWWGQGQNLYLDGFSRAGFRLVSREDLRPGDVLLAHIMSQTVNHGGVYLGAGLLVHHLTQRLSREEPATRWMQFVTHALRHESTA